ncbi:helix-turn-helix domain-containing protein [Rhodospirillum centenum]|uniref:DNA-binding protein, putative n=1 Tax=Rhodospirillum centenum (strain ATCC 51521 / SW) TaxID=414684 RepID=B6IW02_RHOCS|nr:helix-turn-helix domain-containing protein [Rhodospirillum centenum]ACJ00476.1 DNA-binding protein, putative [Rhodospirillum centenum SW]
MRVLTPKDLGTAIGRRRRALGLSQRALAEKAGVSRDWLIGLEQGRPRAELGLVLRTLAALDLALRLDAGAGEGDSAPDGAPPAAADIDLDAVLERARRRTP